MYGGIAYNDNVYSLYQKKKVEQLETDIEKAIESSPRGKVRASKGTKMSQLLSLEEVQELWKEAQSRFTVYEKTYLIPITHLRSKGTLEIIANLKDYVYFKTHDHYGHSKVIQTDEHRKPEEFRVANGLWYLDRKPVYYKWKHVSASDIPDLPEFCMNSYCPLYRDVDDYEKKYYYVNEDSYDDYLREKEGKPSKIDEIIDDAMEFIDDECQSILDEKEKEILNNLS